MADFDFSDAVNPFAQQSQDFDFSDAVNPFVSSPISSFEDITRPRRAPQKPASGAKEWKEDFRPERTLAGTAGDVGVATAKGLVGLAQAGIGLYDMTTPIEVGKTLDDIGIDLGAARDYWDDKYSEAQKDRNQAVHQADGFVDTLTALKDNPSVIVTTVGESVPQMAAGGLVGRGLNAGRAIVAPYIAGAIGEGAMGAGSAAEQIRGQTESGVNSPLQQAAAVTTGFVTGGIGAGVGKFAKKLGIGDLDTAMAGGSRDEIKRGLVTRLIGSGISEGFFEELPQSAQEQMLQNFALGKPLGDGVPEAAAMGLTAGASAGTGFTAGSSAINSARRRRPSAIEESPLDESDQQNIGDGAVAPPQSQPPQNAEPADLQNSSIYGDDPIAQAAQSTQEIHKTADEIEGDLLAAEDIDTQIAALMGDFDSLRSRGALPAPNTVAPADTSFAVTPSGVVAPRIAAEQLQASDAAVVGDTPDAAMNHPAFAGTDSRNIIDRQNPLASQDAVQPPESDLYKIRQDAAAERAKNMRLSQILPPNFDDPRLARDEYRQSLQGLGEQLTKGGDIGYTRDANGNINGRTSSINPDWFKGMNEDKDHSMSVEDTQAAIKKALAGEKLGVRQTRVVKRVLDEVSGIRSNYASHIKEQRKETQRARKEALKSFWDEMPDTGNDPFGIHQDRVAELFNEDNYEPESTYDDRSIAEMAAKAESMGADWRAVDKALESGDSAQSIQALSQLIYGLRNEHRPAATRTETGREAAGDIQPGNSAPTIAGMEGESADVTRAAETGAAGEVAPTVKESLTAESIDSAANEAATSPNNDLPEPTQAQKEAGNYRKGHLRIHGLDIAIENPSGSTRRGVDKNGKAWESTMHGHYGYVKRTQGADGDQVDVFIGEKPDSDKVFVIDQYHADGTFDEHKVVMGTSSMLEAKSLYKRNYQKGWKVGPATAMSVDEFKAWLKDGDTTKPLSAPGNMSAKPRQESSASIPPQPNNDAASSDNLVRGEKSASKEQRNELASSKTIYRIGKSTKRDTVTVKENQDGTVNIFLVRNGLGGEYSGTIDGGKRWLKSRLNSLGNAMSGKDMSDKELADMLRLSEGGNKLFPDSPPESMADNLKSMSDSDFDGLLDDIFSESPETTIDTAKPRAKRPKKTNDGAKLRKTATKPEATNTDDGEAVKRTAGEIAKSMGGNLGSAAVNALEGLTKLFGGANNLNMGVSFDEQTYAKAKPHFEAVWKDFQAAGRDLADFVRAIRDNFGIGVKPYIARWGKDKAAELRGESKPKSLASHLLESVSDIKSNLGLKLSIGEFYGISAKDVTPEQLKEGQEAFEVALVNRSREIVAAGNGDKAIFSELLKLYSAQPNLNVRSSTSIENQAYSTPAPLSYLAGRLAGITKSKKVYEPTAGNGMLLISAAVENVAANELNPERAANLRSLGFSVTQEDGSEYIPAGAMDSAIMNPPFGPLERFGKPSTVDYDGYAFKKIDHLIVAKALEAVKNGGRASIIIAANREPGVIGNGSDKVFFNWLYSHYDVIDHFEVNGDLYSRQGASWPVRVITINGRVSSSNLAPQSGTIKRLDFWDDIYDHVEQVLDSDRYRAQRHSEDSAKPAGRAEEPRGNKPSNGVKAANADGASGTGRAGGGTRSAADRGQLQQPDLWGGRSSSNSADPSVRGHSTKHAAPAAESKPAADRSGGRGSAEISGKADVLPSNGSGVKPGKSVVTGGASEFQADYIAASSGFNDSVLTPKNMAEATQRALRHIENEVGDIDEYVAKKLGYPSTGAAHKGLMALQVDTVAAAIYNIEARDRAIIIADQTGVGKGRQAAALIRYAVRNGKTPVFVTVKPNLFSDMYGDLADIGSGNIRPFITNEDVGVEYSGETLFVSKGKSHRDKLRGIVDSGDLPPNYQALFTTYDQLRGDGNIRRNAIGALKSPLFILDESHNAAGERQKEGKFGGKKTAVNTTAGFVFDALAGHPVVYLSATYAKRPDNMPLYYRTDLMDAVDTPNELIEAVNSGGVPLQQVVAYMLASNGQLFRRERSFAGIKMNFIKDTASVAEQERISDSVNRGLRSIVSANRMFVEWYKENGKDIAPPGGSSVLAGNRADAMAGGVNPFTSVVHNYIRQLLLGIKVKAAAEKAIALHREGKKPVIALENTMGSFLKEYVEKNKLKVGDPVRFTYNDILKTALERSRRVSFKDDKGKSVPVTVDLSDLDFITRNVYAQAEAEINKIDLSSLPASPIDYMLNELKKAGVEVAEITGRDYFVDYSGSVPVLGQRSAKAISSRRKVVDDFNSGNLDALILNAAGSTGLSIHASERFKDQSPRHMIVAQPMLDINVLMQMLGRINRTGQVELPEFTFLSLDLPSEIRPTATTKGKMAKLNANTSANDKSDTSFEAPDFMNKYGDQVVNEFLLDNPNIARETGVSGTEDSAMPDLALRFTGRLALLDAKKQRQAMDEILALYAAKIEYLNSVGMNDLVSQDLPLDAYILESKIVHEGKDPKSVFAGHTTLHKVNAKYLGKPPTASDVAAALKKSLHGRDPLEIANEIIAEKESDSSYLADLENALKKAEDDAAKKLAALDAHKSKPNADQEKLTKLTDAHVVAEIKVEGAKQSLDMAKEAKQQVINALRRELKIGDRMVIDTGDETAAAVVVDIKNTHKKGSGNPWAASKLKLTLMLNSGARQITVNYRQLSKGLFVSALKGSGINGLEEIFNPQIAEDRREIRYVATGNLIAGAAKLKGKIVNFTDRSGVVHQGILLPRSYDKTGDFDKGDTVSNFVARDPAAITKFLLGNGADVGVKSPDKAIKVSAGRDNGLVISLPLSNKNKTVFSVKLDRQLRDIVGDFYSQGGAHVAKIPPNKVREAVDRLIELTPLTIPSSFRGDWESAGGGAAPEAVMSFDGQNFQTGEAPRGEVATENVPVTPAPANPAPVMQTAEPKSEANGRRFGSKFITDAPLKVYTTKKGKNLEGVVAKGIDLEEVKRNVDPYAWKMDGGVFIRMAYVQRPEEPKFSLGNSSVTPISQSEVAEVIARVQSSFGAKLKITAVASAVEFPPEVQAHMEKNGIAGNKVKGVFHGGSIFVNREALRAAQDVETVILHELAHSGLAKMFGPDIQAAMGKLYLAMGGEKTLRELATKYTMPLEKYQAAYANAKPAERLGFMTEELLAHIAQDNKPSVKRFLKELVGAIRGWLRSKGFMSSAEMSESELFALLKEVRQFAAADGNGIRYSLSDSIGDEIEVDGVMRPTTNSSGQKIHATENGIKNFWRWFGDSKVVDENGRPLVVYHGTNADFTEFNDNKKGVFFAVSESAAVPFSRIRAGTPSVVPAYLRIEKPWTLVEYGQDVPFVDQKDQSAAVLKSQGFDGYSRGKDGVWVVFSPNQIKSATGNTGEFNPDNPDIRYSLAGDESTGFSISGTEERKIFGIPTDTIIRKLQDKMRPLLTTQRAVKNAGGSIAENEDAYLAEELFHGKTENDLRKMKERFIDRLTKKMADNKIERSELDLYLWARHAEERNIQIAKINPEMPDGGSGMTTAQANEVLRKFSAEGRTVPLHDAAKVVYGMLAEKRLIVRHGLADDETVDTWESVYQNYVPLKGYAKNEGGTRSRTGRGFDIRGNESMRALGRRTMPESPVLHSVRDLTESIIRFRKNEVGNAFLNLIEANPDPDYWNVFDSTNPEFERKLLKSEGREVVGNARVTDKKKYFITKKNGKEYWIKLEDDLLLRAMQNMGPEKLNGFFRVMAKATRFLSSMVTQYNPEFLITNFQRDIQAAVINLQAEIDLHDGKVRGKQITGAMIKGIAPAMRAAHAGLRGKPFADGPMKEWSKAFDDFRNAGGATGWYQVKDVDELAKELSGLVNMQKKTFIGGAARTGRVISEFVSNANGAVENATRLSVYKAAVDAGISRQRAASLAKNLTVNFNRKGEVGTAINSLYMFFNASVQGTASLARALGTLKIDADGKRHLNMSQKIVIGLMGASFALALLNRGAGGDDDDGEAWWDKVPNAVKERNLVIMKSVFGFEPDGEYFKIPLPYGYNVFHAIANNIESAIAGKKGIGQASASVFKSMLGAFSPIGVSESDSLAGTVSRTVTPTVFKPFSDIAANENFFGGRIFSENMPFDTPKPDSQLSMHSTAEPWKWLAKFMNDATGGSEYRSGWADVSPDKMGYIFNYFTGGAGQFVSSTINAGVKTYQGRDMRVTEIPFARKFVGEVTPYKDQNTFYERKKEIDQLHDELKSMPMGSTERREFATEHKDKLGLTLRTKFTAKELSRLRKQRNAILDNDDLTEKEKDEKTKPIEEKMKAKVDAFNKAYGKID